MCSAPPDPPSPHLPEGSAPRQRSSISCSRLFFFFFLSGGTGSVPGKQLGADVCCLGRLCCSSRPPPPSTAATPLPAGDSEPS